MHITLTILGFFESFFGENFYSTGMGVEILFCRFLLFFYKETAEIQFLSRFTICVNKCLLFTFNLNQLQLSMEFLEKKLEKIRKKKESE
jgi:hypothetical protein